MNTTEFVIEKDVPVPARTRRSKYPFDCMEQGDSILVPNAQENSVRAVAYAFCTRRNLDWRFKVATEAKGIRVWRVK